MSRTDNEMSALITLPALSWAELLVTVDVHGQLKGFTLPDNKTDINPHRSELIAKEKAALFTGEQLSFTKIAAAYDLLDSKWCAALKVANDISEAKGEDCPEYEAAYDKAGKLGDMVDRVREWLCVIRPKTLSECAKQMKYVLSRDDLMLKNSEYDALERASAIIAGLAAFQPTAGEKRLANG